MRAAFYEPSPKTKKIRSIVDVLILWFPCLSRFKPKTSHKIERESTVPFGDMPPPAGRANFVYHNIELHPMDMDMEL
ncbi:hypothetical protein Clacol_009339 [Clathrus columnatus]|uniref:Uncharacterized protein n=1 Tax=Clathrus columnatus TaxID=1419009 RepID=A0AAV5APH6_9AGAM|nr:hypothetical protein Clacol_009339 [Clathrus columnatus]